MASILLSLAASQAFAQDGTVEKAEAFPRLRLGISLGIGDGTMGPGLAASARAGVQIKPTLAVSYQGSLAATGKNFLYTLTKDDWQSHALLVEFTLPGRLITLGGGPSIISGVVEHECGLATNCTPKSSYIGPGLDGRIGATFGANRPNVRGGFTVELAVHSAIHDTVAVLGVGADLF